MSEAHNQFSIGDFSRMTGITVKALRFYHEERLLIPSYIDQHTGYRYYASSQIERARVILYLRSLELPLEEIRSILLNTDDAQVLGTIQQHKLTIEKRIRELRNVSKSIDQFIQNERQVQMQQITDQILEKTIDPILIASIRMKGKYSDCGSGFGKICRAFGRHINGPAMMLIHDDEYKDTDADFESAMPIKQAKVVEGIKVQALPAQRCVTLIHKGPYDQLFRSYERIFKYIKEKGYNTTLPSREIFLKGPGMIFKGNPKNYITEIQIPVSNSAPA